MLQHSRTSFLLCFLLWLVLSTSLSPTHAADNDLLDIHIIAHSHCDPGWLKTVEDYYSSEVRVIINAVIAELQQHPMRKFTWAESSFFEFWYEEASDIQRDTLKKLIAEGRWDFVSGGWVQNDEANPSYTAMIDQNTVGHEYLLHRLGVRPRIAWAIDPFGHSSLTPQLFSRMGFDALVINRVHHAVKASMKQSKSLEFIWKNGRSEMLTSVLHTHYSAPQGYDFEGNGYEVAAGSEPHRADALISELRGRAASFRTNTLLVPFGDDFKFQNAAAQYRNMDRLIEYINQNQEKYGAKIQYSTPNMYFTALEKAAREKNVKFPVVRDQDFFPFADNEDSYWTGYYSTRPYLKYLVRQTEAALRSSEFSFSLARAQFSSPVSASTESDSEEDKALAAFISPSAWHNHFQQLSRVKKTLGLLQHHDAITGTSRGHVVADYTSKLHQALGIAQDLSGKMISLILSNGSLPLTTSSSQTIGADERWTVAVQNTLSFPRRQYVRLTSKQPIISIREEDGSPVPSQVVPVSSKAELSSANDIDHFDVYFLATIPPLGIKTYVLSTMTKMKVERRAELSEATFYATSHWWNSYVGSSPSAQKFMEQISSLSSPEIILSNEDISVHVDGENGFISSVSFTSSSPNNEKKKSFPLQQSYHHFQTSNSGAYIFRPQGPPTPVSEARVLVLTEGQCVNQLQIFTDRMVVSIRVYQGLTEAAEEEEEGQEEENLKEEEDRDSFVFEVEHTLQPLPGNTELILRLETPQLKTDGVFYTLDGMDFNRRQKESGLSIQANFFPSYAGVLLQDSSNVFNVFTPYPMAVSLTDEGRFDIMMHRRLNSDDGRGMGEGNNDDSAVTAASMWIAVRPRYVAPESSPSAITAVTNRWALRHSLCFNYPLPLFVSQHEIVSAEKSSTGKLQIIRPDYITYYSPLNDEFPYEYVHFMSLSPRDTSSDDVILRLQNMDHRHSVQIAGGLPALLSSSSPTTPNIQVHNIRPRALSVLFDAQEQNDRMVFESGDEVFSFSVVGAIEIKKQSAASKDESQNTEEEGVFLSDAAMAMLKKNKEEEATESPHAPSRHPLAISSKETATTPQLLNEDNKDIFLHPTDIFTAIVSLTVRDENDSPSTVISSRLLVPADIIPKQSAPSLESMSSSSGEEAEEPVEQEEQLPEEVEEKKEAKPKQEEEPEQEPKPTPPPPPSPSNTKKSTRKKQSTASGESRLPKKAKSPSSSAEPKPRSNSRSPFPPRQRKPSKPKVDSDKEISNSSSGSRSMVAAWIFPILGFIIVAIGFIVYKSSKKTRSSPSTRVSSLSSINSSSGSSSSFFMSSNSPLFRGPASNLTPSSSSFSSGPSILRSSSSAPSSSSNPRSSFQNSAPIDENDRFLSKEV